VAQRDLEALIQISVNFLFVTFRVVLVSKPYHAAVHNLQNQEQWMSNSAFTASSIGIKHQYDNMSSYQCCCADCQIIQAYSQTLRWTMLSFKFDFGQEKFKWQNLLPKH
jgi:hypothetical protein